MNSVAPVIVHHIKHVEPYKNTRNVYVLQWQYISQRPIARMQVRFILGTESQTAACDILNVPRDCVITVIRRAVTF